MVAISRDYEGFHLSLKTNIGIFECRIKTWQVNPGIFINFLIEYINRIIKRYFSNPVDTGKHGRSTMGEGETDVVSSNKNRTFQI